MATIRTDGIPGWFWDTYGLILRRYAMGGLSVVMIAHPPGTPNYVTLRLRPIGEGEIVISPNSKHDAKTLERWSQAHVG